MATTTTHTQAAGGHKAPFPPFQSETFASQLFWLAIAFAALYLLAARLVLPRVGGIIDARAKQIDDDLGEAQQFKEAADATREKQQAEAESKRKALEQQLDAKLAEAEQTIAAAKSAAMGNVRSIAT